MHVTETTACIGSYREHDQDRAMFTAEFCRRVRMEPGLQGEVLDIGCGGGLAGTMQSLSDVMRSYDGVDPSPSVLQHPLLRRRWHGLFEQVDIPSNTYDLAVSSFVVEHIPEAESFFRTLRRVLKPGGVFWALTPQGHHPFCRCVRIVEWLKLKKTIADRQEGVNSYPAYYRLNRRSDIVRAAGKAGFESLEMVFMPSIHWDGYFPKPVRFVPHLHDRLVGLRRRKSMLCLAYRLQ
jgi:SAM-dependent methyltransferase